MFGIFDAIRDAFVAAVQAVLGKLLDLLNAVVAAWPVGMPELPVVPESVATAIGWLVWTAPLTTAAIVTLFTTMFVVWIITAAAGPALRWVRLID